MICSPAVVLPSEYLSAIWGEDFSFDSNHQATNILARLMRHWNTISSKLFRMLKHPDVYLPVLLQDDEGIAHGNDRARCFMRSNPPDKTVFVSDDLGFEWVLSMAHNRSMWGQATEQGLD